MHGLLRNRFRVCIFLPTPINTFRELQQCAVVCVLVDFVSKFEVLTLTTVCRYSIIFHYRCGTTRLICTVTMGNNLPWAWGEKSFL